MTAEWRPRQHDIARLAKVSQSTVSIVLSGRAAERGISPRTQQRIRDAIAELGYSSQIIDRSTRGRDGGLIGVHTFEPVFPVRSEDYYYEFVAGAGEKVIHAGRDVMLMGSTQPDGTRSLYRGKRNRMQACDGAIVFGLERDDAELERLSTDGFPFVVIGRHRLRGAELAFVTADYDTATARAVERLCQLGHRRIGYLGLVLRRAPQAERFAAFWRSLQNHGHYPVTPEFLEPGTVDSAWLARQIAAGVTAVVTESCYLTDSVAALTSQEGIRVPEDLSIVTLDSPSGDARTASWSHTPVPRRELGERAVDVLLGILHGRLLAAHHEMMPCGSLTPGSIRAAA